MAITGAAITAGLFIPSTVLAEKKPKKKYAILLIDAAYGSGEYLNLDKELEYMGEVLKKANQESVPVYETTLVHCQTKYHCQEDDTDNRLSKYRSNNWTSLKKNHADAFRETDLREQLSKQGVTDLILMGFNQSACVRATAETALQSGFEVHTCFDIMQGVISRQYSDAFYNGVYKGKYPGRECRDPKMVLKPLEIGAKGDMEFYRNNTNLVDEITSLPIFTN